MYSQFMMHGQKNIRWNFSCALGWTAITRFCLQHRTLPVLMLNLPS